jgi:hypothetical protein
VATYTTTPQGTVVLVLSLTEARALSRRAELGMEAAQEMPPEVRKDRLGTEAEQKAGDKAEISLGLAVRTAQMKTKRGRRYPAKAVSNG